MRILRLKKTAGNSIRILAKLYFKHKRRCPMDRRLAILIAVIYLISPIDIMSGSLIDDIIVWILAYSMSDRITE